MCVCFKVFLSEEMLNTGVVKTIVNVFLLVSTTSTTMATSTTSATGLFSSKDIYCEDIYILYTYLIVLFRLISFLNVKFSSYDNRILYYFIDVL